MDKLEQLKALLKELSPEEVEEVKGILDSTPVDETSNEDTSKDEEVKEELPKNEETTKESEDTQAVGSNESEEETTLTEEVPTEETTKEDEVAEEEETEAAPTDEEVSTEEQPVEEETPTESVEEEYIPKMEKGSTPSQDDDVVENRNTLTAETGEEIPVDYEQIIEGLNAKNAALESELAYFKSKTEGAFGYSAKASMPVKTNRLYDDCSDIHFHK